MSCVCNRIGNRLASTEGTASATTYGANDVNAYDWVQPPDSAPREYLCYDDDGNLLQSGKPTADCETKDGAWKYVWDAENRLIGMHTGDLNSPQTNDKWLQFKYDYMGRRVEKTYQVYSGGWQVQSGYPQRFVYDGWNVVLVLDGNNVTQRKYTWGLDLSGTIHGAGGIGGLLAVDETQGTYQGTYWFLYDANGNVGQVLNATSTNNITLAAHYEYDPYGNVLWSKGPYKDDNPFRFSTKWFDEETGLYYYGYRYYSTRLGRWISRDPIGERGGLNVYAFVENIPTQVIDPLGEVGSWEPRWPQPRGWEPGPPAAPPEPEVRDPGLLTEDLLDDKCPEELPAAINWVPHLYKQSIEYGSVGGTWEFIQHWLHGSGKHLWYHTNSRWTTNLQDCSSIGTAWEKLNREAELRLAYFGRKGKANCAKRVCFYQRIDFELEEHFEVNGARISAYNACAIYWNRAGSTWTASCKVRRIIWDGWHWNGIGKDYNWYADTGERKYEWTGSPD